MPKLLTPPPPPFSRPTWQIDWPYYIDYLEIKSAPEVFVVEVEEITALRGPCADNAYCQQLWAVTVRPPAGAESCALDGTYAFTAELGCRGDDSEQLACTTGPPVAVVVFFCFPNPVGPSCRVRLGCAGEGHASTNALPRHTSPTPPTPPNTPPDLGELIMDGLVATDMCQLAFLDLGDRCVGIGVSIR